jgi:hypothetical protein
VAHFTLIRNPVANWSGGTQVLPTELQAFEANLAAAINGDLGGCWAPSALITIGGAGLDLQGPLVIARGGSVTTGSATGIQLQDGDYPLLSSSHSGRTRQVVYPFCVARAYPRHAWRARRDDFGLQVIAAMDEGGRGIVQPRAFLHLRAHDLATLSQVVVRFKVGFVHDAVPTTLIKARVIRVDSAGNVVALSSTATSADPSGYFTPATPSSPSAWYANGAVQSLTLTCDQANTIDLSQYDYFVEVVEESGLSGYPWTVVMKSPVKAVSLGSNLTLSGVSSWDANVTLFDGDRVLIKDQTDPTQNGIWVVHSGPWTRATDLQIPADFTRGLLVFVTQGTYGGSTWQVAPTITSWSQGSAPPGTSAWVAGTTYGAKANVTPTATHATGYWYQTASGGIAAGSEPAWPSSVGQTIVDGGVTWTCMGTVVPGLAFVTKPTPSFRASPRAPRFFRTAPFSSALP